MNLCIDIGNTRTKLGWFENGELLTQEVVDTFNMQVLNQFPYNQKVENCILSATGHFSGRTRAALAKRFRFIELSHETPVPITNSYETPQTLGKDRLAAVVGAQALFPQQNSLVIDAGTCITLDVMTAKGEYLGGNISPGVQMRLNAMHHFTAKLPDLELQLDLENTLGAKIGKSTTAAMINGAQWGAIFEIEGFIRLLEKKYSPLSVIFTGGNTDFFANYLKIKIFARPNLVLIGLNKILNYNVERLE